MDSLLLGVRLLLSAVFVTAAVGKMLDPAGSRRALEDFGLPARLIGVGRYALPLAELVVAAALLVQPWAQWGALGALLLLASFIAAIANALAHGRAPDCHCFGQIHSDPAGAGTLVRNGALAALAVLVVWQGPGPSLTAWVTARSTEELVLVVAGSAAVGFVAFMLRRWMQRRAYLKRIEELKARWERPSGLPVGAPAPDFTLRDLRDHWVSLQSLRERNTAFVLVFTHPACGPCRELLRKVAGWQVSLAGQLSIVVVAQGEREENEVLAARHGLVDVLLQRRDEVFDSYSMQATPSAVAVAAEGTIASPTASDGLAVEALIRLVLQRSEGAAEPKPEPGPVPVP